MSVCVQSLSWILDGIKFDSGCNKIHLFSFCSFFGTLPSVWSSLRLFSAEYRLICKRRELIRGPRGEKTFSTEMSREICWSYNLFNNFWYNLRITNWPWMLNRAFKANLSKPPQNKTKLSLSSPFSKFAEAQDCTMRCWWTALIEHLDGELYSKVAPEKEIMHYATHTQRQNNILALDWCAGCRTNPLC